MLVVLRVKESPPFLWGIFIFRPLGLSSVMRLRGLFLLFIQFFFLFRSGAQTLGGDAAHGFLRLNLHAQTGALGGRNVSVLKGDPGVVAENPALLQPLHHARVSTHFTFLAPSVTGMFAVGAFHHKKSASTFLLGVTQLHYGDEVQTDPSGNVLGNLRAFDQVVGLTVSRKYGQKWQYGLTMKFIQSRYGVFSGSALAADAGLTYHDEEQRIKLGFAVKNMGTQLKTFAGQAEDLPFDMVMGVTKEMKEAPFRLSLTAQRIHQFDLLYNDTLFNRDNFGSAPGIGFAAKLVSHLIFGTEVLLGERVVLSGGYNFLRRRELRIQNIASGLTGFSYGIALNMQRLRFQFARSHYQTSLAHNQVSITLGLGSSADQ